MSELPPDTAQLSPESQEIQQKYIAALQKLDASIPQSDPDSAQKTEKYENQHRALKTAIAMAQKGTLLAFGPGSFDDETVSQMNALVKEFDKSQGSSSSSSTKEPEDGGDDNPPSPDGGSDDSDDDDPSAPNDPGDLPNGWEYDSDGNIKGLENIPEYNVIKPGDSKTVVAAKQAAQRRQLLKKLQDEYKKKQEATGGTDGTGGTSTSKKTYKPKGATKKEGNGGKVYQTDGNGLSVASEYAQTYTSFSGHDLVVTVEVPVDQIHHKSVIKTIGEFQTISYSIHDEKTPVRNIGNMNPRDWVFGPRMVAGTLVITVFNRHWMHELLDDYNRENKIYTHCLMDELPPLNITISAANEYGKNARLCIYGVTFVNEGQVMSINDIYTENTYQFMAFDVDYLKPTKSAMPVRTNKNGRTGRKGAGSNIPIKKKTNNGSNLPSTQTKKNGKKLTPYEAYEKWMQEKLKAEEPKDEDYKKRFGNNGRAYSEWYSDYMNWLNKLYNQGMISTTSALQLKKDKAKDHYDNLYSVYQNKKKEERYKRAQEEEDKKGGN